jgi:hypothetical protein
MCARIRNRVRLWILAVVSRPHVGAVLVSLPFCLLLVVSAHAQSATSSAAPNMRLVLAQLITAVTPVLVTLIPYAARKAFPRIPRIALPFVALVAGPVFNLVNMLTDNGAGTTDVLTSALIGAAGVWSHEVYTTWRQWRLEPAPQSSTSQPVK